MNNFMPSDNKNNNNEEIYNNYIIKSELNKENMNDLNKKAINIKSNLNNIYFTEEEFNNMDFEYSSKYDKRKFIDKGPLDSLGIYRLRIELYKGVVATIKVHIVEEGK